MYIDTGADTRICLNADNADTATKLKTARTISLGGSAAGSVSFDGSANVTIPATINRLDKNTTFTDDSTGGLSYYDGDISNVTNNANWSVPEKGWY